MPRRTAEAAPSPAAAELSAARQRLGLSQAKLGALMGVHAITVNRWEHGTRAVPPLAVHLARCLVAQGTPDVVRPIVGEDSLMTVTLGEHCTWSRVGGCGGDFWRFVAPLTRKTHGAKAMFLTGDACTQHLRQLYETVVTRLRELEAYQAQRATAKGRTKKYYRPTGRPRGRPKGTKGKHKGTHTEVP